MGFCFLISMLSTWRKDLDFTMGISAKHQLISRSFSCVLLVIAQAFTKHTLLTEERQPERNWETRGHWSHFCPKTKKSGAILIIEAITQRKHHPSLWGLWPQTTES